MVNVNFTALMCVMTMSHALTHMMTMPWSMLTLQRQCMWQVKCQCVNVTCEMSTRCEAAQGRGDGAWRPVKATEAKCLNTNRVLNGQ